jgi:hypothetical protein
MSDAEIRTQVANKTQAIASLRPERNLCGADV